MLEEINGEIHISWAIFSMNLTTAEEKMFRRAKTLKGNSRITFNVVRNEPINLSTQ